MPREEHHWNFISPKAYLKKLCSIGTWVSSGREGWRTFLFLALALFAPYLWALIFIIVEKCLKVYGLGMQISGFCLALYGVNSNLKQLGLRSIPRRIWIYLRSMPALPIKRTTIVSASLAIHAGSSMNAVGSVRTEARLSVEDRLKKLEDNNKKIFTEIGEVRKKQDDDKEQILTKMANAQRDSERAIDNVRSDVSEIFESGVSLEVFGIGLFVIGAIYATIPDLMLAAINAFSY